MAEPVGSWKNLGWDVSEQVHKVATLVWDPDTLSWVKYTPGVSEATAAVSILNFPTDADEPLPVRLSDGAAFYEALSAAGSGLTDAELRASPVPVSGTVTAELSAVDNTVLDEINSKLGGTLTVTGGGGGVEYTEGAIDATITGSAILWEDTGDTLRPVSAAKPLPVSGPLTDTELRASAVPVSLASVPSHAVTNAGTFAVQAAQSGTWNITNVSGTVSLPTGAATAAKQPAPGTAGTPSADVLTVQGITSMTALKVDGSAVTQPVSGTFWQATQPVSGTFWQATQPVSGPLTDTQLRATPVPVSGTVTANLAAGTNNIGDVDVLTLPALPAGTNNIGDVDILTVPADPFGANADAASATGSISAKLRFIASTGIPITGTVAVTQSGTWDEVGINDSGNSITVDNNGTFAVQVDGNALTALQLIDDPVVVLGTATYSEATTKGNVIAAVRRDADTTAVNTDNELAPLQVDATGRLKTATYGNVAHGATDAGNPIKVGYKAVAHGSNPSAVTAGQRSDAYCNRAGIPFTIGGHPNIITLEAAYTAAQTDTAIVTIGSGTKIVVTQIQAMCDNANTVDVGFRIGFGTANTPTTTGVVLTHPGVAPGSGISRGDGSGIIGIGADNEDLRLTSEVPTTGSLRILVSYFTIES